MLRRAPGVEAELRLQCPDRALAVAKQLEDPHAGGMTEDAEEGRLRLVDGPCVVRHGQSIAAYLRIFEGMTVLFDDRSAGAVIAKASIGHRTRSRPKRETCSR